MSLNRAEIYERVVDVLKGLDQIDAGKLSPSASFAEDLGLDEMDQAEEIIALDEEFEIETLNKDADKITSVDQAVDYIAQTLGAD
ncbi:acyl carrier protein [Streptomyces sp. NPDC005786]|uniref:acyl carrier protein n=1 Tax=unclassified Streptomyces TaxID=2593676 RepID=UPI0033C7FC62